jgi:hypothetical protein
MMSAVGAAHAPMIDDRFELEWKVRTWEPS